MENASLHAPIFPHDCDAETAASLGEKYHERYRSAAPFPHIVFEEFLQEQVMNDVLNDIAMIPPKASIGNTGRAQERLKYSYNPDILPSFTKDLFRQFNSRPFIAFLERLTGIKGLIPDPYFLGGGIHQIKNGGHLGVHADFNYHTLLKVERRINVLIYLNKNWKSEYGGQLELWDKKMKNCVFSTEPIFNRCVVFTTDSDSYHGNPNVVSHPDGVDRFSIALHYYTATWEKNRLSKTTQFKVRPESNDKFDWSVKANELANDLFPPILLRQVRRAIRILGRQKKND